MRRAKNIARTAFDLARKRPKLVGYDSGSPVFIVGPGRSGSTLTRRVLMASGQIYIPPETYVLRPIIRDFQRYYHLSWDTLVSACLGRIMTSQDFRYFPSGDYSALSEDLKSVPALFRTCADMLDIIYRRWGSWAGIESRLWGDKTPLNTFSLKELRGVFPSAKFLYLQRNIFDVVYSMLKMKRYSSATEAADRYLRANNAWNSFGSQRHVYCMTTEYEALVRDPLQQFSKIFQFCSIDFDPAYLEASSANLPLGDSKVKHYQNIHKNISAGSINQGKYALSVTQIEEVENSIRRFEKRRKITQLFAGR